MANPGAVFLPPYIPLKPLARWATALLVLTCATAWVAVGVDLHELGLLSLASGGEAVEPEAREAWSITDGILLTTRLVLFAATATAFLMWLWQARVNLRAMGVRRPHYGRNEVVTGFLVPILNAVRPYQVIREVWKASEPSCLDPFNWRFLPTPGLLRAWWGAFVAWAGLVLLAVLTSFGGAITIPKLQLGSTVSLVADVMAAVAAFLACYVVSRLSEAQEQKRRLQVEDPALHAAPVEAALA